MQQQKKAPGRPRKQAAEAAPKAAPSKPKAVVKRKLNTDPRPTLFEAPKGGVFLKIRNNNLSVFDPETGRVRGLRYCPQENSVWKDEQSEDALVEQVVFNNKMLVVPVEKPNLLRFLELHPGNKANGGSSFFKPESKEKVAEATLEEEFAVTDAISLIKSRPIDELLPVAMSLKINTDQADLTIKREMVRQAKKDPRSFMAMFDSPMVHARSTVMQAFDFQIVEERRGAIVWFDTGKILVSVPVGQDPVDVLTRFAMTDKGASTRSELERQLELIA